MIVVSMTSWIKRINNVKPVVESIMDNTVQPDRVYLNLSSEEFAGIDLPQDLVDYFNSDDRLIINWVEGKNTKSMKKIFPILKYLDDNDIIINADDDIIFPKDLIESRLNDFKKHGEKYCISSNDHTSIGFDGKMKVISPTSLFQKKMLNHWNDFVTDEIINTYNDDRTSLTLLWLNGYINKGCTKWSIHTLCNSDFNLRLGNSLGSLNHVPLGKRYDLISNSVFKRITGKNIIESFGFWKKK